jgi:hypothetical protein
VKILVYAAGERARATMENASIAAHLCGLEARALDSEKSLADEVRALEDRELRYLLVTGVGQRLLAKSILRETAFCKTAVILCEEPLTPGAREDLVDAGCVRHLVPWTRDHAATLAPTLHRLAFPAAWPLTRTLGFPTVEGSVRVTSHHDVIRFKADVEREVALLTGLCPRGVREGIIQRTHQVVDELSDNALRALLREGNDESYLLSPWDALELRYACDGRSLGVSVTDRVGSLEPWTFFRALFGVSGAGRRSDDGERSLGIGLRATLAMSSEVRASVSPGSSTCVQAYLPFERTLKEFATQPKRVEYFSP